MDFRSVSPWVWVAVAALGLCLLVVAFLVWRRRSKALAKEAPPLAKIQRSFLRTLPASARGDPAVFVLGERLSGKSTFIAALLDPSGRGGAHVASATADPRLGLHAGERRIIHEISGEILASTTRETRKELEDLFEPVALRGPVVVVVLRADGPSFTAGALRELGALVRDKIDILTQKRGRAVRVRVCLTHVDAAAPGFLHLGTLVEEAGDKGCLRAIKAETKDLSKGLAEHLPRGLSARGASDLAAMADFAGKRGQELGALLDVFIRVLRDPRGRAEAPVLDGVLLAAMPEGKPPIVTGDPLVLDTREVEDEAKITRRRQRTLAFAVFAASVALFAAPFAHHWFFRLVPAEERVAALYAASFRPDAQQTFPPPKAVETASREAASSLEALFNPAFPLLRAAYPDYKAGLRKLFVDHTRQTYLFPLVRRPDRETRVYAVSLVYAYAGDDALGKRILPEAAAWAAKLGIPESVVRDYVTLNASPFELPADIAPLPSSRDEALTGWVAWVDEVSSACTKKSLSAADFERLTRKANELSASLEDATEIQSVSTLVDMLRARSVDVTTLFGPAAAPRAVPAWVVDNEKALRSALDLVRKSDLTVPAAAGKSLRQALVDIDGLAPAASTDAAYTFTKAEPSEKPRSIDPNAWSSLVASLRGSNYVTAFLGDVRTSKRLALFPTNASYPAIGAPAVPGRGATATIAGLYTKPAFDAEVFPALGGLDARLEKSILLASDRLSLVTQADELSRRYGSDLREALRAYWSSFRFQPGSVTALRADVNDMIAPSSWFSDFLASAATTASVSPLVDPHLLPVVDAVAEMQPIVALMKEDKGKYPALEKYTAVLATMLPSIDLGPPGPPAPKGTPLADRLAPIGKFSFSLLNSDKPTVLAEVTAFLDGASVPTALRKPFYAPVELAYRFGLSDVESAVAAGYKDDVLPTVSPLLAKFPFDSTAKTDAVAADVEAALGPKGTFWAAFEADVAPVCEKGASGEYAARGTMFGAIRLPSGSLSLARWVNELDGVLWDKEGKPKPLSISAKPLPLPGMGAEETVTLSYIKAGTASVYGFNQTPSFQALTVPWAPGETASVGLELMTTGGGDKRYASVDIEGSDFGLHRLLKKARSAGREVWTWVVPMDSGTPYAISFALASDPFAPFRPPSDVK